MNRKEGSDKARRKKKKKKKKAITEKAWHWKWDGKDFHRKKLGRRKREQKRCHGGFAQCKVKEGQGVWSPLMTSLADGFPVRELCSVAFKESFIYLGKKRCGRCSTHHACDNYLWSITSSSQVHSVLQQVSYKPLPSPPVPYCYSRRLYHMWVCCIYRTEQGRRKRFIFRGRIQEQNWILETRIAQ